MAGIQHNIGMPVNQGMMSSLTPMQLLQQQQQQQQMPHQQSPHLGGIQNVGGVSIPSNPAAEQQKIDHIGKVKNLLWPLKENLASCFKSGAQNFYANGMIDFGTL